MNWKASSVSVTLMLGETTFQRDNGQQCSRVCTVSKPVVKQLPFFLAMGYACTKNGMLFNPDNAFMTV